MIFGLPIQKIKRFRNFIQILSILDNQGNETNRKTISVNYPLIYQGSILLSN
jgi:cytochrome c biogenesis protein ResB